MNRYYISVLIVGLALVGVGCGSDRAAQLGPTLNQSNPKVNRARFGNLNTQGLTLREFDLNLDGETDQWKYTATRRVVRVERDLNFDGKSDIFIYLNASGDVVEEEMDLDLDGVVDVVNYYRAGVLNRKEISVDFTGKFSVVKYYDTVGKLTRVERDTTGDNRIDTWEYFQGDARVRIGRDVNGDGTPDIFEDVEEG
jgi:hypothetical protein